MCDQRVLNVVVVYQCFISNVMITGDIEAFLYSKFHAVLEYGECLRGPLVWTHFERSTSGRVCQCGITMLFSPSNR